MEKKHEIAGLFRQIGNQSQFQSNEITKRENFDSNQVERAIQNIETWLARIKRITTELV